MPEDERPSLWDRLQQEVQEIADVLARQQGKLPAEVWEEALTLYRVRFETEVLPDPSEDEEPTRG